MRSNDNFSNQKTFDGKITLLVLNNSFINQKIFERKIMLVKDNFINQTIILSTVKKKLINTNLAIKKHLTVK